MQSQDFFHRPIMYTVCICTDLHGHPKSGLFYEREKGELKEEIDASFSP